jgi:hypothetical protein
MWGLVPGIEIWYNKSVEVWSIKSSRKGEGAYGLFGMNIRKSEQVGAYPPPRIACIIKTIDIGGVAYAPAI